METKHLIGLLLLLPFGCVAIMLSTVSQRMRDVLFFMLVAGIVLGERFQLRIHFIDEYWYRGTSRGVGLSLFDFIAWSVLIGQLLAPRYAGRRWFWPASTAFLFVYFWWCVFGVFNAEQPRFGLWELVNIPRAFLVLLTTAVYVRSRRELTVLIVGLGTAVGLQGIFALKQHFVDGIYRVPGTLDHENSLSMYLCLSGPVLLAGAFADWSKWLRAFCGATCAIAAVTVLLTLSRAGIPIYAACATGVALTCITWQITRRKVIVVFTVTAVTGLLVMKTWDNIVARFDSASFEQEYLEVNGENRGVYWRWAFLIAEDHPLGVGLNNWSYAVSKVYGSRLGFSYEDYDEIKNAPEKADLPSFHYAPPAHSLMALTLGELGYIGVALFSLVWLRWFQMGIGFFGDRLNADPMHRLAIGFFFGTCGIFAQSVTEWVYRQTAILFTFHIVLGALAALYHIRRQRRKRARPTQMPNLAGEPELIMEPGA